MAGPLLVTEIVTTALLPGCTGSVTWVFTWRLTLVEFSSGTPVEFPELLFWHVTLAKISTLSRPPGRLRGSVESNLAFPLASVVTV